MKKNENAYKTIGEVAELLNLKDQNKGTLSTHTIRYWEKEFKQIKPKILRKRRYYSNNQINLIKLIKFLLKDKGMTVNGVKNVLKSNINSLDDYDSYSLKTEYQKILIKNKSKSILEKIKKIKKHGKKNTY